MASRCSQLTLATFLTTFLLLGGLPLQFRLALALPEVSEIDFQPVAVHLQRLQEALKYLGQPLSDETVAALRLAAGEPRSFQAKSKVAWPSATPQNSFDKVLEPVSKLLCSR